MKHSRASLSQFLTSILVLGAATLGPLLSLSALAQTADTTEPLPENARFAAEINAFQTHDKRRKPREGAVLFLGSSSVRLWDSLRDDFAELPIIKRGFGGS